MKTKNLLFILGFSLLFIITSCTIEKRLYTSGYQINWRSKTHQSDKPKLVQDNSVRSEYAKTTPVEIKEVETMTEHSDSVIQDAIIIASTDDKIIILPKEKHQLIFNNSTLVKSEQTKSTFKTEFKEGANRIITNGDKPKTNGLGLAGFIISLVGLLVFGIILGLLSIIFCAIALGKISKHSDRWKGKGFALAGLIIGVIDIVAYLILLSLL